MIDMGASLLAIPIPTPLGTHLSLIPLPPHSMNVHARISKEWQRRMTMMAIMVNGMALWFCYDGWIAWPAEDKRHDQLVALTAGSVPEGKKHDAENPEVVRAQRIKEYQAQFSNPYRAAERGSVDDIIDPKDTRLKLAQAFDLLETKNEHCPQKKHGNIPL